MAWKSGPFWMMAMGTSDHLDDRRNRNTIMTRTMALSNSDHLDWSAEPEYKGMSHQRRNMRKFRVSDLMYWEASRHHDSAK